MTFLLSRLAHTGLVLLATAFISFVIIRYVGDPVNNIVG